MVTLLVPSSETLLPLLVAVIVEPVIWMGSWLETPPETAVIVAVRLMPEDPPEKVAVNCPLASVVPDAMLSCPVDALKLTGCPDNTELLEDNTVAVRVVVVEPSLFTLVAVVPRTIDAAFEAAVGEGVVVTPLPPQLANRAAIAANIK